MSEQEFRMFEGRVVEVRRSQYDVMYDNTLYVGTVSGRFQYIHYEQSEYPAVGDYVICRNHFDDLVIIEQVKERTSKISRQSVSTKQDEQILATNVDIALICISCNQDFHPRKVMQFLSIASSSRITPVILLTKRDLVEDINPFLEQIHELGFDGEIIPISALEDEDINQLSDYLIGHTSVLLGASGVGKSTLVNRLLKEEYLDTSEIRESDAQGRHTTVHRELIYLPNGGELIDMPGIRILTSFRNDDIDDEFSDIFDLSSDCAFRDCTHQHEPGCKVLEAIDTGELNPYRLEQYQRELRFNRFHKQRDEARKRQQNKRTKY